MEILDLYDRERVGTGETVVRGGTIPEGRYHLVTHVCLFNQQGEMLIQRRSQNKPNWPGLWDVTVGGAAQRGDTSSMTAQRELQEELGISFDFSQFRPSLTINFGVGFDDFYLINREVDLDELCFQPDEVESAMWADEQMILEMIDDGTFMPFHKSLISLLFAMRFKLGLFSP